MLRKLLISQRQCLIQFQRSVAQNQQKGKWDLFAGVLVERLPVVSKTYKPIENEYLKMLNEIEFEQSLKSDHEIRKEKELRFAERLKKGDVELDLDDAASKQTAQDLEDAYNDELKKFQLASRITETDKKNDVKSVNRKLDETLFLLVDQKIGSNNYFLLPQGVRNDGETMRQTAERVLKEKCGDKLNVNFYGNAPVGFYKFKYPTSQRNEAVGAKIFFYRSAFQSGNVDDKVTANFEWIDKEQLKKKLDGDYCNSVSQFLL